MSVCMDVLAILGLSMTIGDIPNDDNNILWLHVMHYVCVCMCLIICKEENTILATSNMS